MVVFLIYFKNYQTETKIILLIKEVLFESLYVMIYVLSILFIWMILITKQVHNKIRLYVFL